MRAPVTLLRSLLAVNVGILALLAAHTAFGQQKGRDNPLEYRFEYDFDFRLGGDVGFGPTWQSGQYFAGCGQFTVGAGLNPLIALSVDRPLTKNLFIEGMIGYQGRSITSTYTSKDTVALMTSTSGIRYVDVDFENKGTGSFSYVFFLPSIKYYIFKGLFVGLGANAGLLLSKSTQYTKTILSKSVEIPEVGLAEVSYAEQESSDPYSRVFPAETRDDASGLALDGVAYIGAEFNLSGKWRLLPRVLYTLPLTEVLPSPENLKLSTLQIMVGVRYELK